ncbi:DUF748 domain-containing protein [Pseudomonas sp. PDM18]|uniref:DUF748 domain-containing protein n=1 Tax=unclassified Pseudomonas TaxID=196821 RepID=UPI00177EA951|nr:DUF748 domain-containing protein [Pseudomonas sp. PDM18]MBD9677783.1 DUF748 domain-containing protein [Pseudomonas sp. PDM18]
MKRRYSVPMASILAILLLLLVAHIALPYVIRDYLNGKLERMGDYHGQIADVDLALWRGAYRINGLKIVKVSGKVPVPLLDAPVIDLAVSWHALWYEHGIVARVTFLRPELNFVDGGGRQESQSGAGTNWSEQLDKLLPITLDELRIEDGRIRFHNYQSSPPVHLAASAVNASLYGLTNVADEKGERVARFEGHARLFDQAPLEVEASFDPFTDFEDFQLRLRASEVELRRVNDFASAYGKFDFNRGHGTLVIEAKAVKGRLSGYIKPLLRDVDVFNWQQDVEEKDKSLFRSIWEALVGGGETVLKNQSKDQFATRVDLSGNIHRQDISAFQAFLGILRNAFIQAFNARYERSAPAD